MTKRFNLKLENDSESSISVVQRYRKVMIKDNFEESLALVHYRGGEEEFQIGKSYLGSKDPVDRVLGADILAQLGWQDRTYLNESVRLLISALKDKDEFVVYSACCALGHRCDPSAIPHIVELSNSPSATIRYGVVSALLGQDCKEAIDVMITLSSDTDRDVRNWAMFGLGSQIELDTIDIREALFVGTSDSDSEIREEALVWLAERDDERVIDLLLNEWRNSDDLGILSLEAAERAANTRLYAELLLFQEAIDFHGDMQFSSQLQRAIDACQPKIELVNVADC